MSSQVSPTRRVGAAWELGGVAAGPPKAGKLAEWVGAALKGSQRQRLSATVRTRVCQLRVGTLALWQPPLELAAYPSPALPPLLPGPQSRAPPGRGSGRLPLLDDSPRQHTTGAVDVG